MKAFFSWLDPQHSLSPVTTWESMGTGGGEDEEVPDIFLKYNSYLVGNLLSLLIGLSVGLVAKFIVDRLT